MILCNLDNMVYADEVEANGSKIYTICKKSRDYKKYKEQLKILENIQDYDVFWYNACTLTNIDYLIYSTKIWNKEKNYSLHIILVT